MIESRCHGCFNMPKFCTCARALIEQWAEGLPLDVLPPPPATFSGISDAFLAAIKRHAITSASWQFREDRD